MRRPWPWLMLGAALLFHALAWGGWAQFHAAVSRNAEPFGDFTAIYYPMGRAILQGAREPVQGFYYSPCAAFLCAPLAALPPQVAAWTWLALELLAVALVVLLPLGWARTAAQRDVYLASALFAFPFVHDLHWGQVSTQLAAWVVLALVLHGRGRPGAAGIAIGIAASIKFYPALFLLPFALRREGRVVGAGLATLVLLLGLAPLAAWGLSATLDFYVEVWNAVGAARRELWHEAAAVQYVPAVLGRWLGGDPAGSPSLPWQIAGGLAFAGCVALLVLRARHAGEPAERALLLDSALLWTALPLVLHPSWPHYFVHLPFAGLVLMRRGGSWMWVAASAFLASVILFRLIDDSVLYARLGCLAAADVLLLVGLTRACVRPRSS